MKYLIISIIFALVLSTFAIANTPTHTTIIPQEVLGELKIAEPTTTYGIRHKDIMYVFNVEKKLLTKYDTTSTNSIILNSIIMTIALISALLFTVLYIRARNYN